jgi:hypothetical protein
MLVDALGEDGEPTLTRSASAPGSARDWRQLPSSLGDLFLAPLTASAAAPSSPPLVSRETRPHSAPANTAREDDSLYELRCVALPPEYNALTTKLNIIDPHTK